MDISLEIFLQTAIFQLILEDSNVLAVFLSGSRSIGLETENSDYDLICLVKEKQPLKRVPGFEVASQVFHTQCFYRDVKSMLENYAGGVWLESLIPEHVLYLNPEAGELWSRFIEKKGEIAQLSNARYHGAHSKQIEDFLKHTEPKKRAFNKTIYYLCTLAMRTLNEPVNKELLSKVKSRDAENVSLDEFVYLQNLLRKYDDTMKENPINKETVSAELLRYIAG